jgi:hypothetical protein
MHPVAVPRDDLNAPCVNSVPAKHNGLGNLVLSGPDIDSAPPLVTIRNKRGELGG